MVARHQAAVARQMGRFTRDPAARDELVHDVFVEAYLGLGRFRGDAPWPHWLRKVAVRVGYRYWTARAARGRVAPLTDADRDRVRGREIPAPGEAAELAHALLARLPPADRLVLTLIYLDGCTVVEAADRAGWSVVGTRVRAFRARSRLRALLGDGSHAD